MITAAIREQRTSSIPPATIAAGPARRDRAHPTLVLRNSAVCVIAAAALAFAPGLAGAASLLDGIAGTWSGRGTVTFDGGNSETLS